MRACLTIILTSILLVCTDSGFPQDKKDNPSRFRMGLTAGASVSTSLYDVVDGPRPPVFSPLIYASGGITFDWTPARWFSLQNSFTYRAKGDRIDISFWAEDYLEQLGENRNPLFSIRSEGFLKHDLRYVEWNLCPTFVIARTVELGIGGFLAAGISGKITRDYSVDYKWGPVTVESETVNATEKAAFSLFYRTDNEEGVYYANRLDYGLCGRLGLRLGSFTLAAQTSYSLNTVEPPLYDLFGIIEPVTQTRHMSSLLSLTWFFSR